MPTVFTDPNGYQLSFYNTVGGKDTLTIIGWGSPEQPLTVPILNEASSVSDRTWAERANLKNGGLPSDVWEKSALNFSSLTGIIEDAAKKGKKYRRILIIGHAGIGDGRSIAPGIALGHVPSSAQSIVAGGTAQANNHATGRLQWGPRTGPYPSTGAFSKEQAKVVGVALAWDGFPTLENDPAAVERLKTALKKALVPGGILQLTSCGYQKEFDEAFGKGAWRDQLQLLANNLETTVVVSPTPANRDLGNILKLGVYQYRWTFLPVQWQEVPPKKE
jgi:hypothetical protein